MYFYEYFILLKGFYDVLFGLGGDYVKLLVYYYLLFLLMWINFFMIWILE